MQKTFWSAAERLECPSACKVFAPPDSSGPLPTIYLLHGQFDTEDDWWSKKGQLPDILAGVGAPAMLLVMPFCALTKLSDPRSQEEPPLGEFARRVEDDICPALRRDYGARMDPTRTAILGISMGGKQAIALALTRCLPGVTALGVLSGKLQGNSRDALNQFVKWDRGAAAAFVSNLQLYFHYCGSSGTDAKYFPGNKGFCDDLGRSLRTHPHGDHNWAFWRPEIAEFFGLLQRAWV